MTARDAESCVVLVYNPLGGWCCRLTALLHLITLHKCIGASCHHVCFTAFLHGHVPLFTPCVS